MPRLIRNTTPDGKCKYGLIRLDKLREMPLERQQAVEKSLGILQSAGLLEYGEKGTAEEFFAIKLKDIHARHALFAYAHSMVDYDPELAKEVFELAARSAGRKDVRHPTV